MTDPTPTPEDMTLASSFIPWGVDGNTDKKRSALATAFARVRTDEREACARACAKLRDKRKKQMNDPVLGAAFCGEAAGADQCERLILERGQS